MKVTNNHYISIDDLEQNLDISVIDPQKTLIQVFSGYVLEDEIKAICSILKKKSDDLVFIGTTTAGEIYEGKVYEKSINLSIMEFDSVIVHQGYFIDDDDFQLGVKIADSLFKVDTKAAILFIDGLETNANDVLDGVSSVNSSVIVAGGLAGDNGYILKTFIFDKNGVYSKGSVGASLSGEKLHVFSNYQLNWQAIGKTMTVTKAEKNRLYEIDGISVSEIYKKYLGNNVGKNLPYSATEFPLLKIEEDGLEICRVFTHQFEDDGSLLSIGNLKVGDKVRFAFGNVALILHNTKKNILEYKTFQPEALFLYSCAARRAFLQSEIVAELAPFNEIASNCGFFTYGELYHHKKKNLLLNISLTILALSEENISFSLDKQKYLAHYKLYEKNFIANKHYLVLDALTHLTNRVISELTEAQQRLKEQANKDYLTGLYNRRYFSEVAKDLLLLAKRERKSLSVIMLDIDKFKDVNDTYGHSAGDEVIKKLSGEILGILRKSDIVSRFGGEEFAILLPFTDKKSAITLAEKLRYNIENSEVVYDGKAIHFTISLGVDIVTADDLTIEEALKRADSALYIAKESGRNRVIAY